MASLRLRGDSAKPVIDSPTPYAALEPTPRGGNGDANGFATTSKQLPAPRLTLEWQRLNLTVAVPNPQTKEVEQKRILQDVSGVARPGELLVVMGPSGAGKSSLLDAISGRNSSVEGSVTVNGRPWSKRLKRFASYVMQDDLFHATLTVKEHLTLQVRLRMGGKFSRQQYMATRLLIFNEPAQ